MMIEKTAIKQNGTIHYWTNEIIPERRTIVLLPGLTADHHLFDLQIEVFENQYNVLVWDAPGHAASRPFKLDFSLKDKAGWLHEILVEEGIRKPILIGQSMGGYVSQTFIELFPGEAGAFVSIDSAPLKLKYYPRWELWLLHHVELVYRLYPWKTLVRQGARGCAETNYGRQLMTKMMEEYSVSPPYYAQLVGHGYRMLAEAIEADLPYNINCPCMLICGEQDKAGDTKKFNRRWAAGENLPLHWIQGAGHNANTDCPDVVNTLILNFLNNI